MNSEKTCLTCGTLFRTAGNFVFHCSICQQTKALAEMEKERLYRNSRYSDQPLSTELALEFERQREEKKRKELRRYNATPTKNTILTIIQISFPCIFLFYIWKNWYFLFALWGSMFVILLSCLVYEVCEKNKGSQNFNY